MRDEKIGPAVAVVVAKGCSCSPGSIAPEAGLLRYIGESPITVVTIENNSAEACDQQIRPAVIVVVTDYCSHGPAGIAYPALVRHFSKCAIVIVVIKCAFRFLAGKRHFDILCICEVDIR